MLNKDINEENPQKEAVRVRRSDIAALVVLVALIAAAVVCAVIYFGTRAPEKKSKIIDGYFDTTSTVTDYSGMSEDEFRRITRVLENMLSEYHRLYDIYNEYEGITNAATLNRLAGGGAVRVSEELFDLLEFSKEMYELTGGEVNVMMGSVLSLWHECRKEAKENPSSARIPDIEELLLRAEHTDIVALKLDRENMTAQITDPDASLDLGAVAKGYATEKIAKKLEALGVSGVILDIGGNLALIGEKLSGDAWLCGVKNPNLTSPEPYVYTAELKDTSMVTSGDYERVYTVDGKSYHHIVDKDTLMPSEHFSSVTVIHNDSGFADALSTALFCMTLSEGEALVERLKGEDEITVIWVDRQGAVVVK